MKIVFITNYWKNSEGGGIKTFIVNLVNGLKNKGFDVNVLFREGDDPDSFHCGKNKVIFSFACYNRLRKICPDVIHSHGTWYCLLPGVIYKKTNGCTLVHTFHTEPSRKLALPARIFFQYLLNVCDCVTFVSKGLQERVVEIYGLSFSKTAITYGGVKTENVTLDEINQFKNTFQLNPAFPVLLVQAFTANSLKVKGLKIVINALKLLKNIYPNIILLATREGIYSNELKDFAQNEEVENHVIFTGDVKNPYIPIATCDIFIFPWLGKSGVGLALLEAMLWGKPIIATVSGGISETIEDGVNGILVEPDPEKIAGTIKFLFQNPEICEKLSRNAQDTAEKKFSWNNSVITFASLYRKN